MIPTEPEEVSIFNLDFSPHSCPERSNELTLKSRRRIVGRKMEMNKQFFRCHKILIFYTTKGKIQFVNGIS